MSEYSLENTTAIYHTVNGYYPGLLVFINGMLYLSDHSISPIVMEIKLRGDIIELIGYDFTLSLYFNTIDFLDGDSTGSLLMKYDFGLSDQSCLDLYNHNISIYYKDEQNGFGSVLYDKVAIERRQTIKNIIDE